MNFFDALTIALGQYKTTGDELYLDKAELLVTGYAKERKISRGEVLEQYEAHLEGLKECIANKVN